MGDDRKVPTVTVNHCVGFAAAPNTLLTMIRAQAGVAERNDVDRVETAGDGTVTTIHFRDWPAPCRIESKPGVGLEGQTQLQQDWQLPFGTAMLTWSATPKATGALLEVVGLLFLMAEEYQEDSVVRTWDEWFRSHLSAILNEVDRRTVSKPSPTSGTYTLSFSPARPAAAARPTSKFGGQPAWITEPQWPICRHSGEKMTFLMQVQLPKPFQVGGHTMAYLFMEDDDEAEVCPCEADGGRNAIVLQGGPEFEPNVMVSNARTGPTLCPRVPDQWSKASPPNRAKGAVEGTITIVPSRPGEEFSEFPTLGGEPEWLQDEETPANGPWVLLLRVDSEHIPCWAPFEGWMYAFVAPDGRRARLLYQFT